MIARGSEFADIPDCYVLEPGIFGYEEARSVFNRMIDRHPSAIVRCRTQQAAIQAAMAAQRSDHAFTVRGGGHSIAGSSVQDDAVCLDFSQLRKVRISPSDGLAYVEPGALMCDLDAAAWKHRLGVTGGIISNTGVAGLALGGGLGWLMGSCGLTCDNIVELKVVDGRGDPQHVTCDHPDMWAFRGIGRKLGVMTEIVLQLHELPPAVVAGRWVASCPSREAFETLCDIALLLPDWMTISPVWVWSRGQVRVGVDCVSTGDLKDTREALLQTVGRGGRLRLYECSYPEAQRMLDSVNRFGRRNYWKSVALPALTPELVDAAEGWLVSAPSRESFISVDVLHGKALTEPAGGSAFPLRDRPFVFLLNTIWRHRNADDANIAWVRRVYRELLELTNANGTTYENYFSADDTAVQDPRHTEVIERWTSQR